MEEEPSLLPAFISGDAISLSLICFAMMPSNTGAHQRHNPWAIRSWTFGLQVCGLNKLLFFIKCPASDIPSQY